MADENIAVLERNEYGLREFVKNVYNMKEPRCGYCYDVRFDLIAKVAKEEGFDAFSTTLLYNHIMIKIKGVWICLKKEKRWENLQEHMQISLS